MTYCTGCGSGMQLGWKFCPTCSAPAAAQVVTDDDRLAVPAQAGTAAKTLWDSPDESRPSPAEDPGWSRQPQAARDWPRRADGAASALWWAATGCTLAAAAATLAALFPDYYRSGESLADTVENLWFNLPAIVGWFAAGALLAVPRARHAGAGLTIGLTAVWAGNYLSDIGTVARFPTEAGTGFYLGMTGLAAATVGAGAGVTAAIREGGRLSSRAGAPLWAMAAGATGIVWAAGNAMNWVQTNVHATVSGYRFQATGTSTLTSSCCTLLDHHDWSLAGQLVIVVTGVLVPVLAASWRTVSFGAAALVGVALALLAPPLTSVVQLSQILTPDDLGIGASQLKDGGLIVSRHGLPGLWVALLAAVAFTLLAAGRALHAASHRSQS